MKTISQGLAAIRSIASDWLTDQGADGATAMGKVTSVLLGTRFDEAPMLVMTSHYSEADAGKLSRYFDALKKGQAIQDRPATDLSNAAADVLAERQRQITAEGWTPEHDDEHVCDEIAALACFYAMPPAAREWDATSSGYGLIFGQAILPDGWGYKASGRRRELVKAGALILAEIERLDRIELSRGIADAALLQAGFEPQAELYTATEEARMDVIGQNGNGGEHYDALPGGLSWESAPDWAIALIEPDAGNDVVTERSFVWVREINTQTIGELAIDFSGRKAGAKQSVCMNHPAHAWTIIAMRPKPAPEAGEWIKWAGGTIPETIEDPEQMVWVRLEGDDDSTPARPGYASRWDWGLWPAASRARIVAYTLTNPATHAKTD